MIIRLNLPSVGLAVILELWTKWSKRLAPACTPVERLLVPKVYSLASQERVYGAGNIAEGSKQQSLSSYIKLVGVSRGSLEELLNDYCAFARQNKIAIWEKERVRREIRERGEIWKIIRANRILPPSPSFPTLPADKKQAVNLLIDLTKTANYLIDRLVDSLKEKHRTEGGFSEGLYRKTKQYRGY